MTTIAASDLPARLAEVLDRVRAGETVLVEEAGTTVAQIAPHVADWERVLGIRPATKHARELGFARIPVSPGRDILEILEEVRADADILS